METPEDGLNAVADFDYDRIALDTLSGRSNTVAWARATSHASSAEPLWCIDTPWEERDIAPRPWVVHGYLMRGCITVVSGPGSAGKSSLMVAWTTALALGCAFNRFRVTEACRVGTYNVEDDADEQRRRYSGMAQQLAVPVKAFVGNLAILGPAEVGTLLAIDPEGRLLVNTPVMDRLERWIQENRPDVVTLDPFVELHDGEENDNTQVRAVMARFRSIAARYKMAIVILHHSRKGEGTPGDPDSLRGASAIVGAARVVLTINVMTEAEAGELSIAKKDRRNFFRLDGAKSNHAPVSEAEWFERKVRILDNAAGRPQGDAVAVAWPWTPPSVFKDYTPDALNSLLDEIAAGIDDGLYSPSKAGKNNARWVGNVLTDGGMNEDQAKKIIATWLQTGLLIRSKFHDKATRKDVPGVLVDDTKRPS